MRILSILIVMLCLAGCRRNAPAEPTLPGDPAPAKGAKDEKKPAVVQPRKWEADAKRLDQLDAPIELSGYVLRPPKGFKLVSAKVPPIETHAWHSSNKGDLYNTTLTLSIIDLPDPGNPKHSVEQILKDGIDFRRKAADNFQASAIEQGTINGAPFSRVEFTGNYKGVKTFFMKGSNFASREGNRLIQLNVSEDSAKDQAESRAIAEAAVFTFRKK